MNALFSSRTVEWPTPIQTFRELDIEFGPFTLDPCATPENAKCPVFFTLEQDGLMQPWAPHRVFMNPPYGETIGQWMRKALDESRRGALVVCLVPARTDTRWWHEAVEASGAEVRFLRGRLRFGDAKSSAPFPSAVVVFRPHAARRNGLVSRVLQPDIFDGRLTPLCAVCGAPERSKHHHLSDEAGAIAAYILSEMSRGQQTLVDNRQGSGRRPDAPPSGITGGDRLLSPDEAAARFGVRRRWILEHADEVGGRRLSRKTIRFPVGALRKYFGASR